MKTNTDYHAGNLELVMRYRAASSKQEQDNVLADIIAFNSGLISYVIKNGATITSPEGEQRYWRINPVFYGVVDWQFLMSCGVEGIINAARTYNPEHESKASFGGYAVLKIIKAIQKGLREVDILPDYFRLSVRSIRNLLKEGNTHEEISGILLKNPAEFRQMKGVEYSEYLLRLEQRANSLFLPESLETLAQEHDWFDCEGEMHEEPSEIEPYLIEAETESVGIVGLNKLREQLGHVLCTLSKRERVILALRFGIEDGYSCTLEEVGHIFEVTKGRVQQIETKALKKLKHPGRSKRLQDYLDYSFE